MGKDSSMDDKWKALEKYNLWGGNTYQLGLERKALEKYNLWGGNTYQLGLERKAYTDKIGNFVGTLCGISYIAL